MPENIILWFVIPSLAFLWFALILDTTRLIRRSDRAEPEQKRWQISLTWLIPFFFLLPPGCTEATYANKPKGSLR